MIFLDAKEIIALIGISTSSILAITGLFLNLMAVRRNNRIAVSTRLAEASKLLTDELVALCQAYQMYGNELKEAETYPESEARTKKISGLNSLIKKNLERQNHIDEETNIISGLFNKLDSVDPGEVDAMISESYRMQSIAISSLEIAREIKDKNTK